MKKRHHLIIYITGTAPGSVKNTCYQAKFYFKGAALIAAFFKTIGLDHLVKANLITVETVINPL